MATLLMNMIVLLDMCLYLVAANGLCMVSSGNLKPELQLKRVAKVADLPFKLP
jgi:hypothetical protein